MEDSRGKESTTEDLEVLWDGKAGQGGRRDLYHPTNREREVNRPPQRSLQDESLIKKDYFYHSDFFNEDWVVLLFPIPQVSYSDVVL